MKNLQKTFGEVAEEYLDWTKKNRTEQYWKRQDRILRDDVIPHLRHIPIGQFIRSGDLIVSTLRLPPPGDKRGHAA